MIVQWAETQIDSAHSPEHLPGDLHGHTWFVRAGRIVPNPAAPSCVLQWHAYVEKLTAAFDHRHLQEGEGLAEQLAAKIAQASGAAEVEVWRFIRGGKVGATWRA